jgi:hypothetical protein
VKTQLQEGGAGYQPAAALRAVFLFQSRKACWKQAAGCIARPTCGLSQFSHRLVSQGIIAGNEMTRTLVDTLSCQLGIDQQFELPEPPSPRSDKRPKLF